MTSQLHAFSLFGTITIMLTAQIGYVGMTLAPFSVAS
jgi:hypothetical protein